LQYSINGKVGIVGSSFFYLGSCLNFCFVVELDLILHWFRRFIMRCFLRWVFVTVVTIWNLQQVSSLFFYHTIRFWEQIHSLCFPNPWKLDFFVDWGSLCCLCFHILNLIEKLLYFSWQHQEFDKYKILHIRCFVNNLYTKL
jgi:hypothetical protein